eukprot:gene11716-12937_t
MFWEELEEILQNGMTDCGLDVVKGALYKIFCNPKPDQEYFTIRLPSIKHNRYGFTTLQLIDYVILPDALCLEHMKEHGYTYEDAVARLSRNNQSRLTSYWNYVLLKDNQQDAQKIVKEGCQIQGT